MTTFTLPHSGLQVPNLDWRVTSYRDFKTSDGLAYTATLRWRGKIVGVAENQGHGGGTWAQIDKPAARAAFDTFVDSCAYADGDDDASHEGVLEDLISEYEWARRIAACGRRGATAIRRMTVETLYEGGPAMRPYSDVYVQWRGLVTADNRDHVLAELGNETGDGWWQAWNGEAWEDLTTRP